MSVATMFYVACYTTLNSCNTFQMCRIFSTTMVFQQVAVFSDSQLRPVVERDVLVPGNWYVNCTPGGTFLDISVELEAAAPAICMSPTHVVLAVGTNDAGQHMVMGRAERHFRSLLNAAWKHFPNAKV